HEYGEWAQSEIDFLSTLVSLGDTVVDVGANVGTHTTAFAHMVGPAGKVVAIEPQPAIFELLQNNVEQNGLRTVEMHACAISDSAGTHELAIPDYGRRHNSGVASLVTTQNSSIVVPTKRLDDMGLERVALLKLDVEGWEHQALLGASALIRRDRPSIYAECNSIELGWRLFQLLEADYEVYLHAPPAFNRENFRRNSNNVFGLAQETNLLFVSKANRTCIDRLLDPPQWVSHITSLDDLCGAFSRALRYGEKKAPSGRVHDLARRLRQVERQLSDVRSAPVGAKPVEPPAAEVSTVLSKPVQIIVPVYNGLDDFKVLVETVFEAYPKPLDGLTFVFINDASPDPRVSDFLATATFSRPDVRVLHNARNLGFIGAVNRGFDLASLDDNHPDVVILNTDTQVHGRVFEILQSVAYRFPGVASVTPLTNNGTIASIWNWPNGGELFSQLEPSTIASIVEEARVPTPFVDVPTGIGFCMYMTRAALDAVGGFDPVFGKGYGEENNWCQTAAKKGFVNLITTEAFVYHHGSQSFGDEVKHAQLRTNMSVLERLHPNYHADIRTYLDTDPLREARAEVQWAIRRAYKQTMGLHTMLYLVHSDPGYFGGGTERHVMALTRQLLLDGQAEVFHVYPDQGAGEWVFKAYFPGEPSDEQLNEFIVARFDEDALPQLLQALAPEVDTLHVHHFLGWPRWFMRSIELFAHSRRLLTLHDYFAACPSIRMIGTNGYCRAPADMAACNKCLVTEHRYKLENIEAYRGTTAHFLEQFDAVLTPSEAARQVLLSAYEVIATPGGGSLVDRVRDLISVAPNFLLDEPRDDSPHLVDGVPRPKRIVFLGAYAPPKGSTVFQSATPALLAKGYRVEVWGAV
ncbi:MAG: FkbM family methyltransferase, partial [Archangium sp.]|nr:FkbM family methyltransferase [Archangium sp.]